MRRDIDAPRTFARELRNDIAELRLAGDSSLWCNLVGVETDLQVRTRPFQLLKNPLACRANASYWRGRVRQCVARHKTCELLVDLPKSLLRNGRNEFLNTRVCVRSWDILRRCGGQDYKR